MLGKLTIPTGGGRYPVVIYAQTAEGMTVDMKRRLHDLISALRVVQQHASIDGTQIVLMGASEETLLIAEAAARVPSEVAGLVMYGVLAEPLRETFRSIVSARAYLPCRRFFDTMGMAE